MILAVKVDHCYSYEHTVYIHSFEAELADWLVVVLHTGVPVVQMGIAVVLLGHL